MNERSSLNKRKSNSRFLWGARRPGPLGDRDLVSSRVDPTLEGGRECQRSLNFLYRRKKKEEYIGLSAVDYLGIFLPFVLWYSFSRVFSCWERKGEKREEQWMDKRCVLIIATICVLCEQVLIARWHSKIARNNGAFFLIFLIDIFFYELW